MNRGDKVGCVLCGIYCGIMIALVAVGIWQGVIGLGLCLYALGRFTGLFGRPVDDDGCADASPYNSDSRTDGISEPGTLSAGDEVVPDLGGGNADGPRPEHKTEQRRARFSRAHGR